MQPAEVWRGSAATSSAPVGVAAAGMESSRPVIVLERSEQPPSSVAPAAGRFDSLRGSDRGRADMNAGPYGGPPRDEGAPRQYSELLFVDCIWLSSVLLTITSKQKYNCFKTALSLLIC